MQYIGIYTGIVCIIAMCAGFIDGEYPPIITLTVFNHNLWIPMAVFIIGIGIVARILIFKSIGGGWGTIAAFMETIQLYFYMIVAYVLSFLIAYLLI